MHVRMDGTKAALPRLPMGVNPGPGVLRPSPERKGGGLWREVLKGGEWPTDLGGGTKVRASGPAADVSKPARWRAGVLAGKKLLSPRSTGLAFV